MAFLGEDHSPAPAPDHLYAEATLPPAPPELQAPAGWPKPPAPPAGWNQGGVPAGYPTGGFTVPGGPATAPTYPYGSPDPVMYDAPAVLRCRFCGSVPAVKVTFNGHRGLVLMMQFLHRSGPMCRDCGLAVFRSMTAKTLVAGWWGLFSFFITPFVLLANLARRHKVANLAAPQNPAPGRRPAPIGKPIYERWQFVGIAVPVIVLVFIIASGGHS